jgi:hypothetical protein
VLQYLEVSHARLSRDYLLLLDKADDLTQANRQRTKRRVGRVLFTRLWIAYAVPVVVFDCLEFIKRKNYLTIHSKSMVTATVVSGAVMLSLAEHGQLSG